MGFFRTATEQVARSQYDVLPMVVRYNGRSVSNLAVKASRGAIPGMSGERLTVES